MSGNLKGPMCCRRYARSAYEGERRRVSRQYLHRRGLLIIPPLQGESPLCNFGWLHPHYVKSRNRFDGEEGRQAAAGRINKMRAESLPPFLAMSKPEDAFWMGTTWSEPGISENQWSQRGPGSRPST